MQTNYTQEKIFKQPGGELESSEIAFSIQPSKSLSAFLEL
jgi:hypothetical protein